MTDTERDPFFIGWLRMPKSYSRLLIPVAAFLLGGASVAAAFLAWGQQSPGAGTWDDQTTVFEGIAYAEPYAMIRVPSTEPGGTPSTILLVEEGKHGAKTRVKTHDGQPVRVRGKLLARSGRQILELAEGDEGIRPAVFNVNERRDLQRSPARSLGPVLLRGELVDAKCYLGAMKPGGGRTHKGCAILCLKGGIPPLFVASDGNETHYLLTDANGDSLGAENFAFAGDLVRLSGTYEQWDDLRVVKVSAFNP